MQPQNFEEKVVWYSAIGTYVLYFLGAQYIFIPAIAWFLTLFLCKKWYQGATSPNQEQISIPITVWVWIIAMLVMEFVLIMGHIDFELGLIKTIFSSVNNWVRQYALFALFPLIGCLQIRPKLIYRSVCIICLQSLFFIIISYLIHVFRLPQIEYISPLSILGGGSDELYSIDLYEIEYGTNILRLKLFAPWCPELGMIGNIYFFLALQESNKKWRMIGTVGAIAMIIGSFSRAAILCLPIVLIFTLLLQNLTVPLTHITTGVLGFFTCILTPQITDYFQTFRERFDSLRASSSQVRGLLVNLALDRWQEAPLWGHAVFVPWLNTPGIGTHHTWVGLLFIRGLVGLSVFLVPLLWSFATLVYSAQNSTTARVGISTILVIFLFGSVIDVTYIAHTYWLGLIMLGIAFKPQHLTV